jgi:beta-glucosidase
VNGEEVVQLYVSGNARLAPLRSLKGFKRISLKAGESGVVSFELTPGDLSVMDGNGKAQPFSGKVTISIGGCQPDAQVISAKKVVQANINVR